MDAVKSLTSLWLIVVYPPFGQDKACSTLNDGHMYSGEVSAAGVGRNGEQVHP